MIDNMRLHRRPVGSALVVVWQRILFQEVPGGMLMNGSVWELELGRWGLLGVHWYWSPGIGVSERWLGARRELEGGLVGS